MALKRYKPTTPGRRGMISSEFEGLSKVKPPRALVEPKPSSGGRNHHGRVTSRFRGGGHKKQYRIIDFRREKDGAKAKVATIEYDPNRTARIALLHYLDGEKRYIIAPDGLKVGDVVESGVDVEITPGNRTMLSEIAIGAEIHDIELKPGKGGQIARAAGAKATLMAREGKFALVRLPSGEQRKIHVTCRATIGQVGNLVHEKIAYGKAGRRRWLGRKPHVRGSVMNPVDHPHGGGEGRCPVGRDPVSPWGQLAKGKKTRCKKNPTSKYIVARRKK